MLSLALLTLLSAYASSPECFLDSMSVVGMTPDGPEYWMESAADGADIPSSWPDSLPAFLEGMSELSVVPGPRTLLESLNTDSSYVVEFASSSWSWIGEGGRIYRARGVTTVKWENGQYYWLALPFEAGESASISNKERMITALIFTVMIIVFALIFVGWAKRSFGKGVG